MIALNPRACDRFDARSDGEMVTVTAKVTNCTNEGTCFPDADGVDLSEKLIGNPHAPLQSLVKPVTGIRGKWRKMPFLQWSVG